LFLRTDREKRQGKTLNLKQTVTTIGQAKAKRKVFPFLPHFYMPTDDSNQPQKGSQGFS
jgi:hypothetical protein